ncbi:hypothetical protein [Azospirillum brasilense]|uniref:hypothetical protein n=1 Tax=Azospirillum brasilense TaxID=192 RepID=UPI0013B381B4|nr:hypothetical protein [Azospirillum brasilense]
MPEFGEFAPIHITRHPAIASEYQKQPPDDRDRKGRHSIVADLSKPFSYEQHQASTLPLAQPASQPDHRPQIQGRTVWEHTCEEPAAVGSPLLAPDTAAIKKRIGGLRGTARGTR